MRLRWSSGIVALAAAILLAVLALAAPARAQDFPSFTGLVVDAANILPPDAEAALTAKLQAFQQKTGRQLVVATVPSLGGDEIQDYGYKLGRAWGVGLKGANNGAILLVAPADRKVGIEVGYGLEGVLTDAYSSVVIQTRILPAFKAGDMAGGIAAGSDALIDLLSKPDDQARAAEQAAIADYDKAHRRSQDGGGGLIPVIVWLVILAVFVFARFGRRGYGRSYGGSNWPVWLWAASELTDRHDRWGGGGSFGGDGGGGGGWTGGGFTGGGGGSFGGGGSSGSW